MKKLGLSFLGIILFFLLGCEHKELCFDHENHDSVYNPVIDLTFVNDWEINWGAGPSWAQEWSEKFGIPYDDLRPKMPTGIRVRVYREDGDIQIYNYPVEGGILHINEPVEHSLLFYNNDTEYIVFNELGKYSTAQATTRTRTRATYPGNSVLATKADETEYTVGPPDMLFGSYIDKFNPAEMENGDTVKVTMHPLVFTYLIRYEFSHGLEYVADTKGALAGMARKVYLNSGKTGKEKATILYDCELKDFGAQSLVYSFGIPDFPNPDYLRDGQSFGLTLEVTLKNGLRKNFDFDVTDQVIKQPHGGVIIVKDIEVPDEAGGAGGGGGFDVDVEDWENQDDIELPL